MWYYNQENKNLFLKFFFILFTFKRFIWVWIRLFPSFRNPSNMLMIWCFNPSYLFIVIMVEKPAPKFHFIEIKKKNFLIEIWLNSIQNEILEILFTIVKRRILMAFRLLIQFRWNKKFSIHFNLNTNWK